MVLLRVMNGCLRVRFFSVYECKECFSLINFRLTPLGFRENAVPAKVSAPRVVPVGFETASPRTSLSEAEQNLCNTNLTAKCGRQNRPKPKPVQRL